MRRGKLQRVVPSLYLALGFLFCDAVAFLYPACQYSLIALRLLQIIIGEFSPLFLYFACELLPVARNLIPIHETSPC